ncbi:hypothetical protein RB7224 [Rhodopirellula baltica SH 1]|uniref:Uncharacterized protein n=1 Tax=Rhodopirellula baltica (strain DSM 10527 / NCIMB 13988 / SH1) TaxID=243090 RepID=Q7UP12_RHOBA|nr:hypothetical protein RB7224 [Rhodopirellula baltica SH 1]
MAIRGKWTRSLADALGGIQSIGWSASGFQREVWVQWSTQKRNFNAPKQVGRNDQVEPHVGEFL